jgi:hypothetical protein
MPIASFHALCTALCAGLGEPPPRVRPDEPAPHGALPPLHLAIADVEITITAASRPGGGPGVHIGVDFGAVPPGREESLLRNLMDANLRMMCAEAPAFARNPQGRVRLIAFWPLDTMELQEAQETLMMLAAHALDWRREAASQQPGSPHSGFA